VSLCCCCCVVKALKAQVLSSIKVGFRFSFPTKMGEGTSDGWGGGAAGSQWKPSVWLIIIFNEFT
jgi:hypothetical protein